MNYRPHRPSSESVRLNALECEWEIGRRKLVARRQARWIPSSGTSRPARAWEPACFYTQQPDANSAQGRWGLAKKKRKRYRTRYPILSGCLPLLKMIPRPSRPELRLEAQHLLYDVQRLPFSHPRSCVSIREGSLFGYPLTSSGRSHGSVSVEGVFDMEV